MKLQSLYPFFETFCISNKSVKRVKYILNVRFSVRLIMKLTKDLLNYQSINFKDYQYKF